ncbi:MAG: S-layer homology domain-containing protein [Candidatus Peregrinibacteria bacterium]|nr:S-layer homology domain-containing protein [Candidatus Peregrinibacteria bacterium]
MSYESGNEDQFIDSPIHQLEVSKKRRHATAWIGLLVLTLGSFALVGGESSNFFASILPVKQHPAFDGTVYPVEKAPNWVALKSTEYKYSYEQIPSSKLNPMPVYNAANLAQPVENLKWGNPADDAIRNQKITYSVPYMGSYRLNGKEFDGSHLAVDIKVPMNTPVRSIANGVVIKVASLTSGFGKHIVIQHNNVPSVDNPSVLTTYYSSYSHLGSILVSEGDVVLRGQNIALSGETGFATTPHVHFQIDKAESPWHPYWPFTYQEQTAAGLDFVGALDAGLGKDKAILNTINPMTFVQQNLTSAPILAAGSIPSTQVVTPPPTPVVTPVTPVVAPVVVPTAVPTSDPVVTPAPITVTPVFTVSGKTSYQISEEVKLTVSAKDASGSNLNQFNGSALVLLTGDVGILSKATITEDDLTGGQFVIQILSPKPGKGQLTILYNDVASKSQEFTIVAPEPVVVAPVVEEKAAAVVTTNKPKIFADVGGSSSYYDAIKYVKQQSVFGGYEDGTFKPQQVISRVEVLKVALKTANRQLLNTNGTLSYADIDPKAWYIPYIATAQQNGIANGYIGGFFKPNQDVTRSEFLKILLLSAPVSIDPVVSSAPYSDVATTDWYAVFAQFAKQKNLLPNNGTEFKPNEEITRAEVAEIIYRLLLVMKTGASTYTVGLSS